MSYFFIDFINFDNFTAKYFHYETFFPNFSEYRIEIHYERISAIQSHSGICFRTNPKNVLYLVW